MDRAIDPLQTIDAKLWADEFMATKQRLGDAEFDHAMMLGWFANAIMRGYDEGKRLGAADAQATIAALQARVRELEQWVQDQSTANLEKMRHTDEMQSRAMEAESQLTQRTAELEAVKADTKNMLDVATRRLHEQVNDLQAELERVRAERDRLALCGHDHSTQWWQVRYEDLASLVAALPKEPYSLEFARHTSFYEPLQALTQHRQGMEG